MLDLPLKYFDFVDIFPEFGKNVVNSPAREFIIGNELGHAV